VLCGIQNALAHVLAKTTLGFLPRSSHQFDAEVVTEVLRSPFLVNMRAAVLALTVILAACSAPTPQAQSSVQPTTTPSATPSQIGVNPCATSQLSLSLVDTQGALGHVFAHLALTNSSSSPCTIDGYPNAQLFNASGQSMSTRVADGGGQLSGLPGPSKFVLASNQKAGFTASWGTVNVGGETCKSATTIEIGLPGSSPTAHLRITGLYTDICNSGELDVSAFTRA
jgi:hypothetical protein